MALANCEKWWRGPEFLRQTEDSWPTHIMHNKSVGYDEMKRPHRGVRNENLRQENKSDCSPVAFLVIVNNETNLPLDPCRYSSWIRLRRILASVNLFVSNYRTVKGNRLFGELLADEVMRAETQLIQHAQYTEFREEWKA